MDSLVHLDSLRPKSHDLRSPSDGECWGAIAGVHVPGSRRSAVSPGWHKKGATEKQIETMSKLGIVHIHVTRLSETLRDSWDIWIHYGIIWHPCYNPWPKFPPNFRIHGFQMDSHSPRPEPTGEFFTAEFKTFNEANGCWADLERIARTATMVQNGSRRA